jgi:cytochrome c-type biogenesis protein CcmF
LAHIGVAIFIIGVTVSSAWRIDIEKPIIIGEKIVVKDIELNFKSLKKVEGPNWSANRGEFEIIKNNEVIHFLYPERRFYPASQVNTSEPAIMSGPFSDLYVVLGESIDDKDSFAIRVYYSPFINWIWFGILLMALGGLVSLSDRKHRLGYALKKNKEIYN